MVPSNSVLTFASDGCINSVPIAVSMQKITTLAIANTHSYWSINLKSESENLKCKLLCTDVSSPCVISINPPQKILN